MPATNVQVKIVDGVKRVFLRSFEWDVFPRQFTIVRQAEAGDHQSEHERNCDSDVEAEGYFNLLSKEKPNLAVTPQEVAALERSEVEDGREYDGIYTDELASEG